MAGRLFTMSLFTGKVSIPFHCPIVYRECLFNVSVRCSGWASIVIVSLSYRSPRLSLRHHSAFRGVINRGGGYKSHEGITIIIIIIYYYYYYYYCCYNHYQYISQELVADDRICQCNYWQILSSVIILLYIIILYNCNVYIIIY